jgi:DNA-binding MarR family transcriptional regulator
MSIHEDVHDTAHNLLHDDPREAAHDNGRHTLSPPSRESRSSRNASGISVTTDDVERRLHESMVQMCLRLRLRGVDLESETGLLGRELDLVALLTASGPTSVKSLVADLQLPRSTMTAIIDRLEARDLVSRHPNPADRRSVILETTPKAEDALLHYRKGVQTLVEHVKKMLSEEETLAFTNSIEKIARTL